MALAGCFSPYSGEGDGEEGPTAINLRFTGVSGMTSEQFFAGEAGSVEAESAPSGPGLWAGYPAGAPPPGLTGYEVILSRGGSERKFTAAAGGVISAKVPPGEWKIAVRALGAPPAGYTPSDWPGQ
ncbi:MAG: hypothetical protein LBD09_03630, partial [Treponema sp.]|nr:hypothetical protein [Treponema sp.]